MNRFQMIDVADKQETVRVATASGVIRLSAAAFSALVAGKNPKGDVLAIAEVAGIMAAKKTHELLPLCHPIALQAVSVSFEQLSDANSVRVVCTAKAIGRTGVEMEALTGVHGALLCIYDLSKAVDPVISIGEVRLLEKRGGKSGHWKNPEIFPDERNHESGSSTNWTSLKVALITLSDRASRGVYEDRSGPVLKDFFSSKGSQVVAAEVVPDDQAEIERHLVKYCKELKVDVVVTTGGTGFGPRDVTPEALKKVCDREIPGFGELLRNSGAKYVTASWLSRSTAGLIDSSLVVCLPGNPKAVREGLAALGELLLHGVRMVRGEEHHH